MSLKPCATAKLPTPWAEFTVQAFHEEDTDKDHLALSLNLQGDDKEAPLVRVHSSCMTGDGLFSLRCDCGAQLETALEAIAEAGCGALIYLNQEGRGIGLANKIRAYELQDQGLDTVEANEKLGFGADQRDYQIAIDMLESIGIKKLRLLTNNPKKVQSLEEAGIEVVERLPLQVGRNPHNQKYLETKSGKLNHLL